jgi:hypothetical protein
MSLLREIQASLLASEPIGPILMKLRFLAARLGSAPLEEWVKHEAEGYPDRAELPDYRKIGVSYTGTFSGPFGSGISNAPIPPYLIEKYAGDHWTLYEIRQSVAAVDDLIAVDKGKGSLQINAANLILLLQGKVYEQYACNSVTGTISKASLVELQNAVRNRVLELTLQIEKTIPSAAEISLGPQPSPPEPKDREAVTQITNQTIYGNVTTVSSTGSGANLHVHVAQGDVQAVVRALETAGIPKEDAAEFAELVATERPESENEPFGKSTKQWIAESIRKAANGTWNVGVAVATKVLTEAALRYYGLKH